MSDYLTLPVRPLAEVIARLAASRLASAERVIRNELACPSCRQEKPRGLVICWPCFNGMTSEQVDAAVLKEARRLDLKDRAQNDLYARRPQG